MRENTRCEVDEPMSTPTLSTTIWSSSSSERPVEEKKMRPPLASCSTGISQCALSCGRGATQPSNRVECLSGAFRSCFIRVTIMSSVQIAPRSDTLEDIMKIELYYAPITCALAPYVTLTEAKAEFEVRPLNFRKNQHNSPEYLKLNPKHKVPLLIVDGKILSESVA